ncbi:hypothetical protein K6119_04680 [Paracrocinitomix mangrovi]|uniref:hypothetical protein n=1 Tax=Paracrocinitomix mangrovi TaxID=2862509 RepID=UPI001C8E94E0|nr:hypothetical protein [Paracrocinitomix mangrovi]UKN02811.1 hypothetical protein K6119_04680 [Paracrocinitomix mangrovi]
MLGKLSYAQGDSLFFKKVAVLEELFGESSYKPIGFQDTSLKVIDYISSLQQSKTTATNSAYLEKQLELAERDYGLSLTGSYLENINPTVGDLEDNLVYNRKFSVGAKWDVLKSGFLENRAKAKILEDRILREQLNHSSTIESYNFLKRFDYTIYTFNVVKIKLLYERERQLKKQYELVSELVYMKRLKKEKLIEMESRLAEVQSLINVYQEYNLYLNPSSEEISFSQDNLPLIDLNYPKIFKMLGEQTDSLLAERQYKKYYSWYHEMSLSPYARFNYYDLIGPQNRSFFSAGVNINVPIPFNTKLRNEVENERYKYDNERLVQDRASLHENILDIGYEFRYKMKQFIGFIQKRKLFMEKLRVEKVKVRLQDSNIDPLAGLDLHDDLLRIDIELIDLLQNMYLKALKIHSKIPYSNIRDIVQYQTVTEINEYIDDKERSVYVWSKTFADYSPEFLTEYAIYNEFKKVVVAVGLEDTVKGKDVFMQYAEQNAEITFMIGKNDLMFDQDPASYVDKVIKKYNVVKPKGIHLDVEPHTFEEWSTERQRLTKQYLEMLGKIKTYCEERELRLAVSIPLHYSHQTIDQILQLADEVYFMCYENVDSDYIDRKVTPFLDYAKDKIVLALRTEDFGSRIEMEEKIKELSKLTAVKRFAYHDLRRMISFDEINIQK